MKIFIIAGEPSGDLHAARLSSALKQLSPEIELLGMGGEEMRSAGVSLLLDITSLAVIGFTEVIKNLLSLHKAFRILNRELDRQKPDAVVLVDYPGFNLRFAREVKKRNIPLFYYISPQIWAWGESRIKSIKKLVDKMIVTFKFEEEIYKNAGVPVVFVGHPLLDNKILNREKKNNSSFTIALLPGSRIGEIKKILPIMLKTASLIHSSERDLHFLISKSANIKEGSIEQIIKKSGFSLPLSLQENQRCLQEADLVLVCSGTATLEVALYQKPMLIIYKTSFFTALLAKFLLKIPYIGLINIIAGREIAPEFVQNKAKPEIIAKKALELIRDKQKREEKKKEIREVIPRLGEKGASRRAAQVILSSLS
ncbi:MAG: lipid-A-disaccharide synthase [Candidatus Omnitrophota bacterium]|nr:MAG: lipid-A-disaccharide synthase [Candidatus Omnitrophota bacterium]